MNFQSLKATSKQPKETTLLDCEELLGTISLSQQHKACVMKLPHPLQITFRLNMCGLVECAIYSDDSMGSLSGFRLYVGVMFMFVFKIA